MEHKLGGTTIRIDNHIASQTWSRSNVTLHHLESPQSKFPYSLTSHRFRLCETCSSMDRFVFPHKILSPSSPFFCFVLFLLYREPLAACWTIAWTSLLFCKEVSHCNRRWRTFNRKWTIVSWFSGRLCSLEWGAVVSFVRNWLPDLSVCLL